MAAQTKNAGLQWSGSVSARKVSVRSGSLIDKFHGRGGGGGGHRTLDCGEGFRITGYEARCGTLVDRVRSDCSVAVSVVAVVIGLWGMRHIGYGTLVMAY